MSRREAELRAALDRTFGILGAAESSRNRALVLHLEEMRRQAVHFTVDHGAACGHGGFAPSPALLATAEALLETLGAIARSTALALVMHREKNVAASELRLRRGLNLLSILRDEAAAAPLAPLEAAAFRSATAQLTRTLHTRASVLRTTTDRQVAPRGDARAAPDLAGRGRANSPRGPIPRRPGAARSCATPRVPPCSPWLAVAIYKGLHIPARLLDRLHHRGGAAADYGATRKRAFERGGRHARRQPGRAARCSGSACRFPRSTASPR